MGVRASMNRLPIVLVVDPSPASRFTLWRALGPHFGVLEAADEHGARAWLARRPDIDALVIQRGLREVEGSEFMRGLGLAGRITQTVVVDPGYDARTLAVRIQKWFCAPTARRAVAVPIAPEQVTL